MDGQIRALKAEINNSVERLTIPKLKFALRVLNLSTGGRKNQMQERILWTLREKPVPYLQGMLMLLRQSETGVEGDPVWRPPVASMPRIMTYTTQTNNLTGDQTLPQNFYPSNPPQAQIPRPYPLSGGGGPRYGTFGPPLTHAVGPSGPKPGRRVGTTQPPLQSLHFRKEPFYSVLRQMSALCEFRTPHLTPIVQGQLVLTVPADLWPMLREDRRLMLLCQRIEKQGDVRPIYYPFNTEIYVNDTRVEANSRGIKGTEGSARPVDLTRNILRTGQSNNRVLFKFQVHSDAAKDDATRQKSFGIGIYLVQPHSIEAIVEELQQRPQIAKETSLRQLVDDADDDIIQTESAHSLKDPVACMRMQLPIRSRDCQHIDCMDAASFITFQKQAPTWKCPHCNNLITFDSLAVDAFMLEILRTSKSTVDRVSVSPDGAWKVVSTDSSDEESSDDEGPPVKRVKVQPEIIDLLDSEEELEQDVASALAAPAQPCVVQAHVHGIPQPVRPAQMAEPAPAHSPVHSPVHALAPAPTPAPIPSPGAPTPPAPTPGLDTFSPVPVVVTTPALAPVSPPARLSLYAAARAAASATPPAASPVSPAVVNTPTPVATPGQPEPAISSNGPWSDPSSTRAKHLPPTATQPAEPAPTVPTELGFDATNYTVNGPSGPVKLPNVYTLSTGGALSGGNAQLACLHDLIRGKVKVIGRAPYFMPVDEPEAALPSVSLPSDGESSDGDIILPPSLLSSSQASAPATAAAAVPTEAASEAPTPGPTPGPAPGPAPVDKHVLNPAAILANAQRQVNLNPSAGPGEPQPQAAQAHSPPSAPAKINTTALQRVLGFSMLSRPSKGQAPEASHAPATAAPAFAPAPAAAHDIIDLTGDSD